MSLRGDLAIGWRRLLKSKVTSTAAVLSLGLAIGACAATFRLMEALFLRPLPVANAARLHVVAFQGTFAPTGAPFVYDSSSYPMFEQMRARVKEQADMAAVSYADRSDLTYGSEQDLEKANLQYVSGAMFPIFGLRAETGRLLTGNDDVTPGAHPVVVLSYAYWQNRFGGDPKVVGRTLHIGESQYEIVGVCAPGFTGTETGIMTDVFIPMMMKNSQTLASKNNFWLRGLVVLHEGASREAVEQQLAATFHTIQLERAEGFTGMTKQALDRFFAEKLLLEPAASGRSNLQRDFGPSLKALGILVALVLFIACANVANLMTARAASRSRELALRISIGASRGRLFQLLLVESALLALLSAAAGVLFAAWSAPLVVRMIQTTYDSLNFDLSLDWRFVAFAFAITLLVTVAFGLPAALRASHVQPSAALKGGTPHSNRRFLRASLIAQVAFCCLVLFAAGLFVMTFDRLSHQPLGYTPDRVLNLETYTSRSQPTVYWEQVAAQLGAVDGIESVAMSGWPLMSGESSNSTIAVGQSSPSEVFADYLPVSRGWLATMNIPLIDGRDFRPSDSSVAIVNQAFAKQYFDGTNPVGRFFDRVDAAGKRVSVEIVGYAKDARYRDRMRLPIRPTFFTPLSQAGLRRATFVVRTSLKNPLTVAPALRQTVRDTRPDFHVGNTRTQNEIVESKTVRERVLAVLALFFAVVALILAGVGLYGVLDYSVLQQRREIGIRMAIGAQASNVAFAVASESLAAVGAGAAVGLSLGIATARFMESLLYDVRASDWQSVLLPALAILAVSFVASMPAVLRAVRIDPVTTLRESQ